MLRPQRHPSRCICRPIRPFAPEPRDKAAEAAARASDRAAEKRAAQEEANTFPYGVTVGQLYDGPLDLLLDLIRKQDIDIYDIPIAKITGQFLAYIENLKQSDIDGAGEFIYMASLADPHQKQDAVAAQR